MAHGTKLAPPTDGFGLAPPGAVEVAALAPGGRYSGRGGLPVRTGNTHKRTARSAEAVLKQARALGYPLVIKPLERQHDQRFHGWNAR